MREDVKLQIVGFVVAILSVAVYFQHVIEFASLLLIGGFTFGFLFGYHVAKVERLIEERPHVLEKSMVSEPKNGSDVSSVPNSGSNDR